MVPCKNFKVSIFKFQVLFAGKGYHIELRISRGVEETRPYIILPTFLVRLGWKVGFVRL